MGHLQRTWLAAALMLPAILGGMASNVQAPKPADSLPKPPSSGPLFLVFSTEANGYLAPCGCSSPMVGGFLRRATYVAGLARQGDLVRVDNGDLTLAMGRQDELKADALTDMLSLMHYEAVGLGESDFRLGVPYLLSLQARFKGAILCANARKADGTPSFGEMTVVNRQAGGKTVRVAITAVLSDQYSQQVTVVNPDVTVEPPAAVLERLRGDLMSKADLRILLYHGPKAEAQAIARQFPIFQVIVYGHEGDHPVEPIREGGTLLVCSGQDGKYVGRVRWSSPDAAPDSACTALGPEFRDDHAAAQVKTAYLSRVTAEGLLAATPRSPTPNGDTFAGTAACGNCHAEPYRVWKASGHAKALQTLAGGQEDQDPECVACHVVGMSQVGGFASREKTPNLADVGCESCHGAGAKHAADPKTSMPKAGAASCGQCHIPQHSPRFEFAPCWAKIKH